MYNKAVSWTLWIYIDINGTNGCIAMVSYRLRRHCLIEAKKHDFRDERPVLFVGYLYDGTVKSAIRPSDDTPNDVLRSSYK